MNNKQKREKSRKSKWYGMKKISSTTKLAWVSQKNKHGFSLGLGLNSRTLWLRNLRFATKADVQRALKSKVVYF